VEVARHHSGPEFLAAAGSFLSAHETTNHLVFAIAARDTPGAFYATAGGRGVALQTPPYPLLVSELPTEALDPLIELVAASGFAPTSVNGPAATSRAFAERWCASRALRPIPRLRMRSHVLERVTPAVRTKGVMRAATASDLPMLVEWTHPYLAETHSANHEPPEVLASRLLPNTHLWVHDGEPVCMASIAGSTPNGRRIGFVFTPRAARRRGHAEALVAALSQKVLDEGLRYCFLFTDVNNPTSNAVYARIGYEANGEIEEVSFVPASSTSNGSTTSA
jgi:RimJ/RimL family protein N-acetyltransferase